jgi:predicted NUDIX family NTP pyrophosphohydrolase
MPKRSAGVLLHRRTPRGHEVLLVHPGGPFWARRDEGAWSIPKGELGDGEEALAGATREFEEETGFRLGAEARFVALGRFRQSAAKTVEVWAVEGDVDPATLVSGVFSMEWPPRSGQTREFPEVDRAAWFAPGEAVQKIVKGQIPILAALDAHLNASDGPRQRAGSPAARQKSRTR